MSENTADINIILKLIDEATTKLKEAMGEIKKESDGVKKDSDEIKDKSEKETKAIKDGHKSAAQEIRSFRRDLMLVAGAFTAVYLSTKQYARYNQEAKETIREFDSELSKVKLTLGAISTQIIRVLNATSPLLNTMKLIRGNTGDGLGGAIVNDEKIRRAQNALDDFNQKMKDTELLYRAGGISSQEYYDILLSNESQVMYAREQGMAQMQAFADLQMTIANEDLMNAQRITQEKITLLQYYQETSNTANQGMAAFSVTVGRAIQTNLSSALVDFAMGAKSAKEAFSDLGQSMIRVILDFMIQKVVAFVLEKTLLAGTVAASTAAAAEIAAAWAPAAVAVNIATMGSAGVSAAITAGIAAGATIGAMTSAGIAARTISVESQMSGKGQVLQQTAGWGGGMAEGGSGIVTRPTIFLAGEGGPEHFQFTPLSRGNSRGGGGDINITLNAVINNKLDIAEVAEELGFELERRRRYARGI